MPGIKLRSHRIIKPATHPQGTKQNPSILYLYQNYLDMRLKLSIFLTWTIVFMSCKSNVNPPGTSISDVSYTVSFPAELAHFSPYPSNPVFKGSGKPNWDEHIRERGFILYEDQQYFLWYTGYRSGNNSPMSLGLATSGDGLSWDRYPGNPIFDSLWTEDMMVIKSDSMYYMFAEGNHDIAHLLTSGDRVHWSDQGSLDIRKTDGTPISVGPYGTPTVIIEGANWFLFYERNDEGIWLAKSTDLKTWTNVQDNPVLEKGPETYDRFGLAMNQVIKHHGKYYGYYHGTAVQDWSEWSTNVAVSPDLVHWSKYSGNPVIGNNKSSGILVHDGFQWRMYTMHPEVNLFYSGKNGSPK